MRFAVREREKKIQNMKWNDDQDQEREILEVCQRKSGTNLDLNFKGSTTITNTTRQSPAESELYVVVVVVFVIVLLNRKRKQRYICSVLSFN